MGKRKSEEKKKRSYLLKKIRKLEKRIKSLDSDSTDEDTVVTPVIYSDENDENNENLLPELIGNLQPEADIELLNNEQIPSEETLDSQVLEILGIAPQQENKGEELHTQIAERWDIIIKKGLTKEEKEKIEKENSPFANFKQMLPPKLNPELNAAVNEMSKKRDQLIYKRQQQVTTALTCIGSGLQMCVKDFESQKMMVIKKLNEASRLLCDSLYLDTKGRRSLLLSIINKDMKEFLLQSESDSYLFGENLTDKIKTAKSVQKSGQELKITDTKKFIPRPSTSTSRPNPVKNKALNWRGPPHTEVKKRGGPSYRSPAANSKREDKRTHQRRK